MAADLSIEEFRECAERVVALESRVAFQDVTIEELNQVLTQQQRELAELRASILKLAKQIGTGIVAANDSEPPPHY